MWRLCGEASRSFPGNGSAADMEGPTVFTNKPSNLFRSRGLDPLQGDLHPIYIAPMLATCRTVVRMAGNVSRSLCSGRPISAVPHFDVGQEMDTKTKTPEVRILMGVSIFILVVFYPMTIAAVGPLSNGGFLGFSSLLIAAPCSWTAFVRSRPEPLLQWLVCLPIATVVTRSAAWDGLAQYQLGR